MDRTSNIVAVVRGLLININSPERLISGAVRVVSDTAFLKRLADHGNLQQTCAAGADIYTAATAAATAAATCGLDHRIF